MFHGFEENFSSWQRAQLARALRHRGFEFTRDRFRRARTIPAPVTGTPNGNQILDANNQPVRDCRHQLVRYGDGELRPPRAVDA